MRDKFIRAANAEVRVGVDRRKEANAMRKRLPRPDSRRRPIRHAIRHAQMDETDFDDRELIIGGPADEPKDK
jgi:hypothetical protein